MNERGCLVPSWQALHKCIEEHVKEGDMTSYCKDALAWA